MRTVPFALAIALAALLPCCAGGRTRALETNPPQTPVRWAAPPLEHAISIRDGRSGERLGLGALLDRLTAADVVFLGETHVDETTHRAELAIYEGLLERRDGRVALALEMFERDVQPVLDGYVAGEIPEAELLARARPWTNYVSAYRPLVERAREAGGPLLASNFPAPLRRALMRGGPEALDALEGDQRRQAPAELLANTPEYWRRVDNAVRGHRGMMGGDGDDARLMSAQSLWDNSMGETCARALVQYPEHLVLHVNGGFHSQYWDGTVRQLLLRAPEAEVLTVALVPSIQPAIEEIRGAPEADYVVFTEQRARDLNEGTYAVHVLRELEYRLHLPEQASADDPVPLLIWLGDEGLTSEDGLALWRERLGDECALAVLEPPYRETGPDLAPGGRWFWPDTFSEDVHALREALERTWAFQLRHHPIDPSRVCLAGEGSGATVAAAVGLLTWRIDARAVALAPRHYAKIKDIPLPLPEIWGDDPRPDTSLRLLVGPADEAWWAAELEEYAAIDFDGALAQTTEDPWLVELERENTLRSALGLAEHTVGAGAPRLHAVVEGPRARHWARLAGNRVARERGALVAVLEEPPAAGGSTELDLSVRASEFAAVGRLPRCPGPFGGTTVVVLPTDISAAEAGAWAAVEQSDPLARTGPFHRLRVAGLEEGRSLPEVLERLRDQGRENVLVVPAAFCADGATMTALRHSVRHLEDAMTLHWRPGLGGLAAD